MLHLKKTQNYTCDDKFTSLCAQEWHLYEKSVVLKEEEIFQHNLRKLLLVGTTHGGCGFGE